MGGWGNLGSPPQKGIITYALSPNRQSPMAGAYYNAFFNIYRRTYHQILYWVPPLVLGYVLMEWATEKYVSLGEKREREPFTDLPTRNEYLNSKPGRLEAEAAEGGGGEE
ncbi:ubiquinol-cytochrome c reductase subunit 8 [Exophiala aquamarina CBS 119918]|uniref:Cytochrome b-c1 complex subunit 8 n=1 Tax=Exophiala aquamarina CBS 119918 TaxID=1182545 RepID=A0A072P5K8_9EURO|nr:ubiquinol-cytochrome c reductase subunit 8 [Exophiala aquamarina CBS 119918]KEF55136.1 ubiquinol-cytochrome c reductase subunit 8 [Exophiala aquamarina CBS 119918]